MTLEDFIEKLELDCNSMNAIAGHLRHTNSQLSAAAQTTEHHLFKVIDILRDLEQKGVIKNENT